MSAFGLRNASKEGTFIDVEAGALHIGFHKSANPRPGNHKLCFYVENVGDAAASLAAQGAVMGKPRGDASGLWFCDGQDPEGNIFQISNRK